MKCLHSRNKLIVLKSIIHLAYDILYFVRTINNNYSPNMQEANSQVKYLND